MKTEVLAQGKYKYVKETDRLYFYYFGMHIYSDWLGYLCSESLHEHFIEYN